MKNMLFITQHEHEIKSLRLTSVTFIIWSYDYKNERFGNKDFGPNQTIFKIHFGSKVQGVFTQREIRLDVGSNKPVSLLFAWEKGERRSKSIYWADDGIFRIATDPSDNEETQGWQNCSFRQATQPV